MQPVKTVSDCQDICRLSDSVRKVSDGVRKVSDGIRKVSDARPDGTPTQS